MNYNTKFNENIPDMRGVKETATRFGVHIHHMRYLALSGKVKAVRVGKGAGKILINQQSVIDYFNNSSINESDEEKTINGIKPIPVKL